MSITYVDNDSALLALCEQLSGSPWLAVDTEFHREKTYYPELCLVQVANEHVIACVDPYAVNDLTPLFDVFYDDAVTLIFHAARQDLELFYLQRQSLPKQIFDTQLAASVLGYGDQIGYGNLVQQCLHIELDKAHSRTDWRQRPLSQAQIDYAADDVRYLRELYPILLNQLESQGREQWLQQDFANLTDIKTYQEKPDLAWQRVKGFGRLKPRQLSILSELANWREQRAIELNRPRKWILKDEVLLDLAKLSPNKVSALKSVRSLEQRDIDRHGARIISLIEAGLNQPKEQWPTINKPTPLTNQQEALVDILMGLLRKLCDDHNITPVAVAPRKEVEKLVRGENTTLNQGWRFQLVGETLQQFINGAISIEVDNHQLNMLKR
jgi:ribonuclease D